MMARKHLGTTPLPRAATTHHICGTGAFAKRLWALLRIRMSLTAMGAAELLTDAGDNVRNTYEAARLYLNAWATARPELVQVAKKRINGRKLFVLVRDLGPQVPNVTPRKRPCK